MKRGSELISRRPSAYLDCEREPRHWLRLRPGTDAALALGMMNVIINEDLVRPRLRGELVRTASMALGGARSRSTRRAKVAEICWVDEEDHRGSGALLRQGASFHDPVGPRRRHVQDRHANGAWQSHDLAGITGNIDNPGGNILIDQAGGLEFGYNSGIEYAQGGHGPEAPWQQQVSPEEGGLHGRVRNLTPSSRPSRPARTRTGILAPFVCCGSNPRIPLRIWDKTPRVSTAR